MGRHERRLRRLEQQLRERHATSWEAHLSRMTYDEFMAELTKVAVRCGMPEDLAKDDPDAAFTWGAEFLRTTMGEAPEQTDRTG